MSEQLTVTDDNVLRYGDKALWADVLPIPYRGTRREQYRTVDPRGLEEILRIGRSTIDVAIEAFYREQYDKLAPKGYTVTRPSMWVAQLGNVRQTDGEASKVYTQKGYDNGGIHWDPDEQHPAFYSHWQAVERAGFVPHVRGSINGAWLMLRNDDER